MSTLRAIGPNGVAQSSSFSNVGGAASLDAALTDNSDVTYGLPTALGNFALLDYGTLSFAANERIEYVHLAVRNRTNILGKFAQYIISQHDPVTGAATATIQQFAADSSPRWDSYAQSPVDPNKQPWTPAVLDRIQARIGGPTIADAAYTYPRFYEVWMQVQHDTQPFLTGLSVDHLDSSRPRVFWTYNDTDGDLLRYYRVKVFSSAQYSAPGFSPDTSVATWDSGQIQSSGTPPVTKSTISGANLAPGTTYRFYVQAARDFVGVDLWWSDWAFSQFTTTLVPPLVPLLSGLANDITSRAELTVQSRLNELDAQSSSFEDPAGGVGQWTATGATLARSTTNASNGTASLAATAAGTGGFSLRISGLSRPPVFPGQQVTVTGKSRAGTTTRTFRVDLEFYFGAILLTTVTGSSATNSAAAYAQQSATGVAPATATAYTPVLVITASAAAEVHRFDDLSAGPGASTTWSLGGYVIGADHQLEYSDDGGVTWVAPDWLRAPVTSGQLPATIYDYSAIRGGTRRYRARTEIETPTVINSDPSAEVLIALALPQAGGTGLWWMKDLDDPTHNFMPLTASFDQEHGERIETFRAEGRTYPIPVSGGVTGYDGTLTITTVGGNQWRALQVLLGLERPFLVQSPDGEQWMVRRGPSVGIARQPSPAGNVVRQVSIPFEEVETA